MDVVMKTPFFVLGGSGTGVGTISFCFCYFTRALRRPQQATYDCAEEPVPQLLVGHSPCSGSHDVVTRHHDTRLESPDAAHQLQHVNGTSETFYRT